jgi:Na+/proline symporter
VANNWAWWSFLLTGMATVFFYARLWRRSGVMTDLELYELRYSGRAATLVRGFRAVYLGLFFNCIIMATVNLAAAKIAAVLLGWPMTQTLLVCAVLNVAFAATSGLWGVMVTDFVQFGVAMGARSPRPGTRCASRRSRALGARRASTRRCCRSCRTSATGASRSRCSSSRSPCSGGRCGTRGPSRGGSYIAQRMLAARTERDALAGTLLFNVAHYALRSWPWIVVALASTLVYPSVADIARALPHVDPKLVGHDMAYPAMLRFLPPAGSA